MGFCSLMLPFEGEHLFATVRESDTLARAPTRSATITRVKNNGARASVLAQQLGHARSLLTVQREQVLSPWNKEARFGTLVAADGANREGVIEQVKHQDLPLTDLRGAASQICSTAKSMGIEVVDR